jgi:hypothetical protein
MFLKWLNKDLEQSRSGKDLNQAVEPRERLGSFTH